MGKLRAAHRLADHRRGGGRADLRAASASRRTRRNMSRWRLWWRRANLEQFVSFACIGGVTIIVFSLVAYSTVYGNPDLPDSSGFDFISLESQRARRHRRLLVRHAVPGRRRGQPLRRRAGDRRLRLAPGRRRDPHRLHARAAALDREQDLLRRRLGDGHVRLHDPAARLRPAAGPADDLDRPRRRHHARLHCLLLVTNRRYLPGPIALRGYRARPPGVRRSCCSA